MEIATKTKTKIKHMTKKHWYHNGAAERKASTVRNSDVTLRETLHGKGSTYGAQFW